MDTINKSYWWFILESIGVKYLFLFPLAVVFATWLVWRLSQTKSNARTSSLLGVTVLLPFGVGLMGMLDGLTMNLMQICRVDDALSKLRIGDVAVGFMQSFITGSVGLMLSAIPYFVAVFCACRDNSCTRQAERSDAADSR